MIPAARQLRLELLLLAAVPVVVLSACGARTDLGTAREPVSSSAPPMPTPACTDEGATQDCSTLCGAGTQTCRDGQWQDCSAPLPSTPGATIQFTGTIRDFHSTHPDFEKNIAVDPGIVAAQLGPDGKPVYAGHPTTLTTHGKAAFDEWYRDVPGINLSTTYTIDLTRSSSDPGVYVYDNDAFFPIDDELFGNEGNPHNYHFTYEIHQRFFYRGGETFSFSGDDDLWVFINGQLAIDLGGVHATLSQSVDLDASADKLGITVGQPYTLDIFFAERHTSGSTFHIETSIQDFIICE